ncbi:MAG: hypothetical protein LQ344_000491 [Seirophora lacunosa]|nr:MAG: hypothetical protein LQ344_000491 [Seirophora lacunosa]
MPPLPPPSSADSGHSSLVVRSHPLDESSALSPSTSPAPANSLEEPSLTSVPSKKRKRTSSVGSLVPSEESSSVQDQEDIILSETTEKPHSSSGFFGVRIPPLVHPKSLFVGHESRLPPCKERLVLREILEAEDDSSQFSSDEFISIDLEDFSIYRPQKIGLQSANQIVQAQLAEKPKSNELVSLHELSATGSASFLLEGTLCFGNSQQRHVQRVVFETLSIGCYEDVSLHTVGSDIWVQSVAGRGSHVWYRLIRATPEYARYHEAFLWLADLAKHIIDYLQTHEREKARLRDFKDTFASWLQAIHGTDQDFRRWFSQHPSRDFRHVVAAHGSFLYNQAGQLGPAYASHDLWGEIDPSALNAIPRQPAHRQDDRTVVTPYVYQCFSHMPWAKYLDPVSSINHQDQSLPDQHMRVTLSNGAVQIGDIVAIKSDSNTAWKTNDDHWYAYVQGLQPSQRGHRLSLLWVYRPADTACQHMRYPHANELFLSDHCNCGDAAIHGFDVAAKVRVALFGNPDASGAAEFFIRQKYNSADSHWTTLRPSDLRCRCNQFEEPLIREFVVGDTLLVKASSPKEVLEPVVLTGYASDASTIHVRRLLRKRDDYLDLEADPNELVYSSRIDVCDSSMIVRRCHVRFYTLEDHQASRIPAPYNRKGTGDCYYILSKQHDLGHLEAISRPWPAMNQGFDPNAVATLTPMRGLDLFCGGGSFGRGLEEGGAVKMEWAVDYSNEAIHTYHANSEGSTKIYNGSVNDYLSDAIHHRRHTVVAQQGEVAFICAGNPCPGFSTANNQKHNVESQRNISLAASVVAYADFYRPQYLIMENVLGMANCSRNDKSNVFAQILCALLGLGYQVRTMLLDSWNFGAPQSRSRLFITATAPGLEPLQIPAASHSHPASVIGRSLGKTANGLPFSAREWMPTPFEYVTIGEATQDLPENIDGRTPCIKYPDHRVTRTFNVIDNVRLSCIPRFPPGMTFVKSARLGWQPPPQMATWHWDSGLRASIRSKSWQRARCNALLPTVTTMNSPSAALTGSALHWDAERQLTVMEARRGQGIPDEEVIIGSPAKQWKIIGNSVTRQVAIVLGGKLREAWLANGSEGHGHADRNDRRPPSAIPSRRTNDTLATHENQVGENLQSDVSDDDELASTPSIHAAKRPDSTTTAQTTPGRSSAPAEISSKESSVTVVK